MNFREDGSMGLYGRGVHKTKHIGPKRKTIAVEY